MRLYTSIWASVIVLLAISGVLQAAVIYVDADATGANDGESWTNAFRDLQAALNMAESGDEIKVACGTYKPTSGTDRSISFELKNGVSLMGGYAGNAAPNIPDERDPLLYGTFLSGAIGPNNSYHVVVSRGVDATAVLDAFIICAGSAHGDTNEEYDCGGGMYNYFSSPTITYCEFQGNSAVDGGGMYNHESHPTITSCNFLENDATSGGGIYNYYSSPTITYCRFSWRNSSDYGGGMYNFCSDPIVTNCTFTGNDAIWGGGMYDFASGPTITGCTFTENVATLGGGMYDYFSYPTVTNCTFTVNLADEAGGMHDLGSSPIITGCTFTGNDAVWGGGMSNYDSSPTITGCTFSNNSAGFNGGGMYNDGNSDPTVDDCSFAGNWALEDGGGMYKDESHPTITNCAFLENDATSGGEMYNYYSSPTITNCTFTENGATEGGGMYNFSSDPIVTNCTFTSNEAYDGFGGGMCNNYGMPIVTDSTFTGNGASDGGGMCNRSSEPIVNDSTFIGNKAYDGFGGGMYNGYSYQTVNNCTFISNKAYFGGGMYNNNTSLTVTNCTFTSNRTSDSGGGMCNEGGSITVTNCILWGDEQDEIAGSGSATITYSDVQGSWPGAGNINADPMFADSAGRLSPGSLCIDAGDTSVVVVTIDLDGNPRIVDGDHDDFAVVDMGAYEHVPPDTDADDDGIDDAVDTKLYEYSNDFDDGTTGGTILDRADQIVFVLDALDPLGVKIGASTSGGAESALVSVCGEAAFELDSGDAVVVTCGSVEITVVQGMVEIVFFAADGTEAKTSLNAGNSIEFEPETLFFIAPATNTEDVVILVGGIEIVLAPGKTKRYVRASIDIEPDTLNLTNKNKWITCYIELPQGFDVGNIDVRTVMLYEQVRAELHPTEVGDYDSDGEADLMVKFKQEAVQDLLDVGDAVQISVAGELNDGTFIVFEGSDTIRVIEPGQNK